MVVQTADQAVSNAKSWTSCDKGMCLWTVQEWLKSAHMFPSAWSQWQNANRKHTDRNPPKGAPVYYSGGQYGHIALSLGNGKIRSTDCQSTYVVSDVDLDWPTRHWGYPYAGWSEDIAETQLPYLSGASGTAPREDDDVPTVIKGQRKNDQKVSGDWRPLYVDDTSKTYSYLSGPAKAYEAVAALQVVGLAAGAALQARYRLVKDYSDSRDTVIQSTYPIQEIIGTSGDTYGAVSWVGDIGDKASDGGVYKLRLYVKPPDGVQVTIADHTWRVLKFG